MRCPQANLVLFILIITFPLAALSERINTQLLSQDQTNFLAAKYALKNNKRYQFQQLRKKLHQYPLAIYLDYNTQSQELMTLPSYHFINKSKKFTDTPLELRLKHQYLLKTGKQKRWQDFLAISPTLPRDKKLQCYYYRAKLAQGDKITAYSGAKKMWLNGYSLPKACDPLFYQWQKSGFLTQKLIWKRLLLAFDAKQINLVQYLVKQVTTHKKEADYLLSIYYKPARLFKLTNKQNITPHLIDVINAGIKKLSKYNLNQSTQLYIHFLNLDFFDDDKVKEINRYIVKQALIQQNNNLVKHVDNMLPLIRDDHLTEMRLRWALRNNDYSALEKTLPLLSEQTKNKPRWLFWLARIDKTIREKKLTELSQQRNYYGFIAAQVLNHPIKLQAQHATLDFNQYWTLINSPGFMRTKELMAINNIHLARQEWKYLLQHANKDSQLQYAIIAKQNKWYALGVQGTIQAKLWDHVSLRFPFAHQDEFNHASKTYDVSIDEIMAIARRESAFHPQATSPVGAKGLMQLMPKTAKYTAKKYRIKLKKNQQLYEPSVNIKLGTAYYSELLDKFNDNRVLATAAYNAGPHRVKSWLNKTKEPIDVFAFIESIPFKETREYVQAVFSYRLIYETQRGEKNNPFFSVKEMEYLY